MGRCVASGCKETGSYKFPSDAEVRKKWEKALRRFNFKATDNSRLCRKHFKETDFETASKETGFPQERILKKSSVPSIFSWNTAPSVDTSAQTAITPSTVTSSSIAPNESETNFAFIPNLDMDDLGIANEVEISNIIIEEDTSAVPSIRQYVNQSTQTPTLFKMFYLDDIIKDDKAMYYYTGLETYKKFKLVLSTLSPMAHNIKYIDGQVTNVDIEDQFLLMLMKLRLNMCDFELSKYFGVSKAVVSNIFVTWVNFTYQLWSLLDVWPTRDLVDYYMPQEFKKHHANTRVIIDVTEIPITKPKNPTLHRATFNSLKNKNTMKFLVGATPGGLFSYCSEGYGGSTSDREMVERSDLLEKCESGDSIMADRRFDAQDIFASKNIVVKTPGFPKGKSQLPGVVVKHDKESASQRVHIKRLIGLSKTFTILKTDLKACYVPLASRIFFVCVMLCNFRESDVNKQK